MANMSLTGYTFAAQPNDMTPIRAERSCAKVDTYSSVGFFSWGPLLPGKEILLEWTYMPADMFVSLDTLYQADAQVVFDPQDGTSKTYNVEIIGLEGKYCLGKYGLTSSELRKDVKMKLLIISEVT
jgi:hypothetical protein